MKTIITMILLSTILSGCAEAWKQAGEHNERRAQEQRDADLKDQSNEIQRRERLQALLSDSDTVKCHTKISCDKAFSLTKVFIQQHTDMKIQFSDDTTVSTHNATQPFYVAMTAVKIPGAGESASITLTATCKSLSDKTGLAFSLCADKVATIYENFKPFVESKI